MSETLADPLLKVLGLSKNFGGVAALREVSFDVGRGECLALVGENGAGKTTLINILHGAFAPDSGTFDFDGQRHSRMDPLKSLACGLNVIHQDLALVNSLLVMENVFLSRLEGSHRGIVRSRREMRTAASEILDSLGCDIDPLDRVESLSISKRQIVEIAKALASEPKLLIMDEPTASLTQGETAKLFDMIRAMKARGISIIFVSHRLNEVMEISDRVSVLRDGKYIGTVETAQTNVDQIVSMMVGRELDLYHKVDVESAGLQTLLEVRDLTREPYFRGLSFEAHSGEILCFSGLVGAGRSEMAQTIFGFMRPDSGQIFVGGEERSIRSPGHALSLGIGLLPEDRKLSAVIDSMNVRENVSLAILPRVKAAGFVKRKKETVIVRRFVDLLHIKTANIEESITNLSGGNQQKVMIARWMAAEVSILIVDEPTQGVDVGAKAEIHRLLKDLALQGVAVIVISSDLPEVLSISDRIIIMRRGRIAGELKAFEASEEKIMKMATYKED